MQSQEVQRVLVVPGEVIAEGDYKISTPNYVVRVDRKYVATIVGLAQIDSESREISVIPLEGCYIPQPEDIVIGYVVDTGLTSWELDIRAPFTATLYAVDFLGRPINPAREDLNKYLTPGDTVLARVEAFDRNRGPIVTTKGKGLGKVVRGTIVEISPVKVARVIGRRGSMYQILTNETGCEVTVARNGRILINCPSRELEEVLVMAILKIEREAHIPGLTDRVKEFIIREKVKRGLIGGETKAD
ncbi:MAG: exosome complex RNA-binding protein Rrp4 [Sulfolobales archaeon]|nr:exosome complex RNA-binding protein Rrp4 [Sulfolobales archaeon]MCX8208947.1 exosome complex RNA-binding protein Rrp4 [Sulfolobales archaeon]MDW8010399.1 exosome complex RNA-binding protein Rrp4 [Sulfolobales archaeon]